MVLRRPAISTSGKTILLVDDEAVQALMCSRTLEKNGYKVITALSGEKAIAAIDGNPDISLILMDIDLGSGIDGTEAALTILGRHELPLIFISSHTEPDIVARTEGITSYGYVVKNTGDVVLLASIKMAFRLYEAKLRDKEKEEKLLLHSLILDQIQDRVTVTDLNGRITYVNKAVTEAIGMQSESLVNRSVEAYGDNAQKGATQKEIIERTLKNGRWRGEVVNYSVNGDELILDARTQVIFSENGKPVALCGISTDITGRKQLEEKYRLITENTSDVIWTTDLNLETTYVSPSVERLLGESAEEHIKRPFSEKFFPEDQKRLAEIFLAELEKDKTRSADKDRSFLVEVRNKRADGTYVWVEFSVKGLRDASGRPIGLIGSTRNISERREAENILQIQRELSVALNTCTDMKSAFDKVLEIVLKIEEIDCGGIYEFSPEMGILRLISHYGLSETFINSVNEYKSDSPQFKMVMEACPVYADYTELKQFTDDIRCKEGLKAIAIIPVFHQNEFVAVLNLSSHQSVVISPKTRSILELLAMQIGVLLAHIRSVEKSLKREEQYRLFAQNSDDVIWAMDFAGNFTYISPSVSRLLGYTSDEFLKLDWFEIISADFKTTAEDGLKLIRERISSGVKPSPKYYETQLTSKNGEPVWAGVTAKVMYNEEDSPAGICGMVRDISERKKADKKLLSSLSESNELREKATALLAEKEIILNETHHRIKNNMQTICGLLLLQAGESGKSSLSRGLKNAAGRVQSMMLLYDRLYRTEKYNQVNLKDYLSPLVEEILRVLSGRLNIKAELNIGNIILGPDRISPLGIIINELVTNSIKHAFPGKKTGSLELTVSKRKNKVTLTYSDNGKGLPHGFFIGDSNMLGLQLVEMLVKQLKGTVKTVKHRGTRFIIKFDV